MKSIIFLFCLILFTSALNLFVTGENVSVFYPLDSTKPPIIEGNIYAADLVWAPNTSYTPNGQKYYYRTESDSSLFVEFKLAPIKHHTLEVDEISFHIRTVQETAEFEVRYYFHSNLQESLIEANHYDNSTNTLITITETNIFVPKNDTLYIRIYPFNSVPDSNTDYISYTDNFTLKGTTQLIAPALINYNQKYLCKGEGNAVPEIIGDTGGTFSSESGLIIDTSTGVIDVNNSINGTYSINYTTTEGFVATTDIIIDEIPECNISGMDTVCPSAISTYSAPEGMESYFWEVNGNASIIGNDNEPLVSLEAGTSCNSFYEVTLTIQKESGCSNSCTKKVIISESDALELIVPENYTSLPCDQHEKIEEDFEEWLSQAAVYGGCNSNLIISEEVDLPLVPPECGSSLIVEWKALSDCGTELSKSATFTVPDKKPTIKLTGNEEVIVCLNDTYYEQGATVLNNSELDDNIIISGEVDTSVSGTYYLTYNVSDAMGNAADEVIRTVIVNEMPAAYLRGSGCSNGETELFVTLKGIAPWNFTWSDGENEYQEYATVSPFKIIAPPTNNTISVNSVTDANGCTSNTMTEAVILSAPITFMPEITACPNTEITVPITVHHLIEIRDISLTLEYDPQVIQYTGYDLGDLDINDGLMVNNVENKESNILRISYSGTSNLNSGEESAVLLNLKFHYTDGSTSLKWIDEEEEDCEYSFSISDNEAEFERGIFCDTPFEEYYINGFIQQLPACGTEILPIPEISTLTGTPVIIPVIVEFPEMNEEEINPDILTSLLLTCSDAGEFPTGSRINDIRKNGTSILNTPYSIEGKKEINLNEIWDEEPVPLINFSNQKIDWQVVIDGINSPLVLTAEADIVVYTSLQESVTLDSKTFSINYNQATLEVPESLTICSDEPLVFSASFKLPVREYVNTEIIADGIIKMEDAFAAGTIINWTCNSDQSGSYIFDKDTSTISFSSLINEEPYPLQNLSTIDEWNFEIINHNLQSETLLTVDGITKLADTTYSYVTKNTSIIVHQLPEPKLHINGSAISFGSNTSLCKDELISIELGEIINGTAPINVEWEVYQNDSDLPDAELSGSATEISTGFTFINNTLDPGIYTFKIINITDQFGCSSSDLSIYWTTITINPLPEVSVTSKNTTCQGSATGSVTFIPSDELLTFNYYLEPGGHLTENHSGRFTFNGLATGEYIYTVTDSETNCNVTGSITIEDAPTIHLSGNVRYYHQSHVPLDNVTIELIETSTGETISSTITSLEGKYSFDNICPGIYEVELSTNQQPGGINTTDAGQVNAWNVARIGENYPSIETVRFLAGDVNTDGEDLRINANDAALIQEHFVTFGNPGKSFDNNWEFWKAGENIDTQPQPQQPMIIEITDEKQEYLIDFFGLVSGDFNSSFFRFDGIKSFSVSECNIEITEGEIIRAKKDTIIELPLTVNNSLNLGAISLIFSYPDENITIEDVYMNDSINEEIVFNTSGDLLRISWYSTNALAVTQGDTLLIIKIMINDISESIENLNLKLVDDPLVELADGNYNTIHEAIFIMDEIISETSISQDLLLTCYPNPYDDHATVEYVLPEEGSVRMDIIGLQGNKIGTIINKIQPPGKHKISLNEFQLLPGVYQLFLIFTDKNDNHIHQSIRILRH